MNRVPSFTRLSAFQLVVAALTLAGFGAAFAQSGGGGSPTPPDSTVPLGSPLPGSPSPAFPGGSRSDVRGLPQGATRTNLVVGRLRVMGESGVDSARITRTFDMRPGQAYALKDVQAGVRRLWATDLFDDVDVFAATRDREVDLTVSVRERPRIRDISFQGTKKVKDEDLAKHLGFHVGDPWRLRFLASARDSVLAQYRDEGYRNAEVTVTHEPMANGVSVRTTVKEGDKTRVTAIAFEGNAAFDDKALRKKLSSKKKGLLRSGTIKEEKLTEDLERLREFYRSRGYRDVSIERMPFAPDPKGSGVVLAYQVREGPFYRVGEVDWRGTQAVSPAALRGLRQPAPGETYDASKIEAARQGAYALYAEEGYLYLGVEPTETVRDSNVVDLAFQISEGPPSHVRQVRITGNTYTKEKVIRRELGIHEGDLFRRSLLVRSQQDVFRLGFFEDVGLDFLPIPDTSDVDLLFKIKEKQTGTASAGAGYSSEGGLTGFLNLGHNNLFGNGQSMNFQIERGSRRTNLEIGFTDPWFRDTRTVLGADLFNTRRERDPYLERRRGGSVRVGRPATFVDRYTRALLTYSLEGVKVEIDTAATDTLLTPEQQVALESLRNPKERITSSIELGLSRNSTNNPFYATRGNRSSFTSEFAGGPLGGAFDFNKTRLESRWYLPSFLKPLTTMLRIKLGALNAYSHGDSIPVYERFRLGGTTFDGLRGYDDYEVVPHDNVRFLVFDDSTNVYVDVPPDTPGARIVRYPGGRLMGIFTLEQQFLIVNPVHGIVFFEAGDTWNNTHDIQPFKLRKSAGVGVRLEVPFLGNVGFDYGYGFDRDQPGWKSHFLLGNAFF